MYEKYYALQHKPFQTNPDPSFYFDSSQHRRAMAYLKYGLHRNEGFIVITGEVGAGKTTLVRSLLSELDSNKIVTAHLVSTQLDAENALRLVGAAFGLAFPTQNKADLLLGLERFFVATYQAGRRCILIIDEAQNLSMQAVEELRMLSNFQRNTQALLQSFLIGQPEFRDTLQSPQMTQLRQRVIAACHIGPLENSETQAYIEHRLSRAGWKDAPPFSAQAYAVIHKASGGIPRRINTICDRLLLTGFLSEKRFFSEQDALEVASEIENETLAPRPGLPAAGNQPVSSQEATAPHRDPTFAIDKLTQQDFLLRLTQVENRITRIESALEGLLRNNTEALALLARFVHAAGGKPEGEESDKDRPI